MFDSNLSYVGVFFVLLCVAGFSTLDTSISDLKNYTLDATVISYTDFLLDNQGSNSLTKTTVCVLSGSEGNHEDFSECIADSGCKEWEQHTGDNGNIAMICQDPV